MLLVQAQAYRAQYGLDAIYLLLANMSGPADAFDLQTSHVMPALIRECVEASEQPDQVLTVWGTGWATREFLYVDDAARAALLAAERYDKPEPANVGTSRDISIRERDDHPAHRLWGEGGV
jgi:GDP-L-fucose synthase